VAKTVADTKQTFFVHFTRPLNSIYRRVLDELLVEAHLLTVHHKFRYDPFFALGFVTLFDRFMDGYFPAEDKASIFSALAIALGYTSESLRQEAQALQATSPQVLLALLQEGQILPTLPEGLQPFAANPTLSKYSRIFALGLSMALEKIQPDSQREEAFSAICTRFGLDAARVKKDLDFYSQALEQVRRSKEAMEEANASTRKKRETVTS